MKKIHFCIILLFPLLIKAQAPIAFERYYDFGWGYSEEGFCVQQTFDGGYIIAGRQGVSFGTVYLLLQKVDSVGQVQWYKTIGDPNNWTWAYSVKQTTDSGYIATGLNSDASGNYSIYIVKTNSTGDTTWTKKHFLSSYGIRRGVGIIQTSDGGYTLLASLVDDYTDSLYAAMLIKTDSNGDTLWTKKYKAYLGIEGCSMKQTTDGGYIISAMTNPSSVDNNFYLIKTDSAGDTLWTKTILHPLNYAYQLRFTNCIQQTADGGYFISGTIIDLSNSDRDILIIKTNSLGDTLWTKRIGNTGEEWGWGGGFQTDDGGYAVLGITSSFGNGGLDVYLIKTDNTGIVQWTRTFGGSIDEYADYLMSTTDGGFIISGMETSWGDGGGVYLIKTDSMGFAVTGISPLEISSQNQLLIYPNPFRTSAIIEIGSETSLKGAQFILYDMIGKEVKRFEITGSKTEIQRNDLPAGMYFCTLYDLEGKIIAQTKIIIQ